MTKHILWKLKYIILFLEENINICSFNNKSINYKKNYISYYVPKAAPKESCSSTKDD